MSPERERPGAVPPRTVARAFRPRKAQYVHDTTVAPKHKPDTDTPLLRDWKFMVALNADREMSGDAKAVAFALLEIHNNEDGFARPGHAYIAKVAGTNVTAVRRGIRDLQRRGWFCVQPMKHPNGDWAPNRYFPVWGRAKAPAPAGSEKVRKKARTPKALRVAAPSEPDAYAFVAGPVKLAADEVAEIRTRFQPWGEEVIEGLRDAVSASWTDEDWRERLRAHLDQYVTPF